MTSSQPSIEFFVGIPEELSNVSLRRNKSTGNRTVLMTFDKIKALEKFQSFTARSDNNMRLIDSEGEISVTPSKIEFVFGGDDGDELRRVDCAFEVELEEHWERFMRFMHRYAEANGMAYSESEKTKSSE